MDEKRIEADKFISFDQLRKRWTGADEGDFINLVNKTRQLPAYVIIKTVISKESHKKYYIVYTTLFYVDTFQHEEHIVDSTDFFFLLDDVLALEKEYPELIEDVVISDMDDDAPSPETNDAEYIQQIHTLEAENANLVRRIQELEEQLKALTTETDEAKRTDAATAARQEQTLDRWKEAFKPVVPFLLGLAANGVPSKRLTRGTLTDRLIRISINLNSKQLEYLWSCLPEEYKNRGGAPNQ